MKSPKLSRRLFAIASDVPKDAVAADIGCDHGQLAVYLACQGVPFVYASDLNPKPLASAEKTIRRYHVQDRVTLLLGDGLSRVPHEVDTLILSGMGGELICDILFRESWIKKPGMRLILQPQSFLPLVRKRLYQNGFAIIHETPVVEKKHTYLVLLAQYTGKVKSLTDVEAAIGRMPETASKEYKAYLRREYTKIHRIRLGQQRAKTPKKELECYLALERALLHRIEGDNFDDNC